MPRNAQKAKSVVPEQSRAASRAKAIVADTRSRASGRGGYNIRELVPKGTFKKLGGMAGGALGGAAGSAAGGGLGVPGALIGSNLGARAGAALAKAVGFGDYTVQENSLLKTGISIPSDHPVPQFVQRGGVTVVTHREYVRDVIVPADGTPFINTQLQINPANMALFPWLSTVASRYQQWRMRGMIAEFKSLSSDITAGGALGSVILATNYNANEPGYESKVDMENSEFAVSAKPSVSQLHAIECAPQLTAIGLLYIGSSLENAADGEADDARLYNLGNLQVATVGLPNTAIAIVGELWVTYEVELHKPVRGPPAGLGKLYTVTGVSKTVPFGTVAGAQHGVLSWTSGTTCTAYAEGDYLLVMILGGVGGTACSATFTQPSGETVVFTAGQLGTLQLSYFIKLAYGTVITPLLTNATTVTEFDVFAIPFPYSLR